MVVRALLNVLLVEDDSIDVEALTRYLRQAPEILLALTVVDDGEAALHLLRQQQDLLYPYIILLDLRLPRIDGLTFLRELRRDALLKGSVVFMLTLSSDEAEIDEAYRLGIAGYIHKPDPGSTDLQALVNFLIAYATIVQFPRKFP